MGEAAIPIIVTGLMLTLFLLGCNIGISMAIAGFLGIFFFMSPKAAVALLAQDFFTIFSNYPLTAITFFMLMGQYAYSSGAGRRLFTAASTIFKKRAWGLPAAVVMSAAGFAAICGSYTATTAAIGRVALPEMRKREYEQAKVGALLAAGGVLGPLIPPSSVLIIYGFLAEESVGTLFMSGIIPGLMLALLMIVVCIVLFRKKANDNGKLMEDKVRRFDFNTALILLKEVVDIIIVFCIVIGGIYTGWFTPTQGAVIGCVAMIIDGVVRRELGWRQFWDSTIQASQVALAIFIIIAGATVYGRFLTLTGISDLMADWLGGSALSGFGKMLVIILIYLIAGCFIDILPLILITVPILLPIIKNYYDPIWFGIVLVLLCGIGVLTPPVGVNLYVVKGLDPEIDLGSVFLYCLIFIVAILATIALLLLFPKLGVLGKLI